MNRIRILSLRAIAALFLAIGFLTTGAARAAIVISTVPVGNAGNAGQGTFGAVAADYRIGAYEVTNTQYAAFLNAVAATDAFGLYNTSMGAPASRGGITRSGSSGSFTYAALSNRGNKPVNYVSWYDAARFTNWLHNGQPTGAQGNATTETGAYTLLGGTTTPTNGLTVARNPTAAWFLPSEDEWYKAAYYDPTTASYFTYSTSSNTTPTVAGATATGVVSNPGANVVNYSSGASWGSLGGNVTTVGSAGATSPYGTFDQGGNVAEWNEALVTATTRGIRGGNWGSVTAVIAASFRNNNAPTLENNAIGFRVATVVPEPSSAAATGGLALLATFTAGMRRGRRTVAR